MTLAVVALFAEGPTTIRNVAHIRHKETDRIAALATELRKLGGDGRRVVRWLADYASPAARRANRNLQRPPDGDEPGTCRIEDSRRGNPRPAGIGKNLSGILPRPGNARGECALKPRDGYPWAGFASKTRFSHTSLKRKRRNTGNRCLAPSLRASGLLFLGKPPRVVKTSRELTAHCVDGFTASTDSLRGELLRRPLPLANCV